MPEQLADLKILVTRPEHQAAPLCEAITALGGEPIRFPLLQIEPLAATPALRQQIQNLDNYQILIFISTNAATFGARLIDQYWPQFPLGIDVLAIGPTTATTLQETLALDVHTAAGGMHSEAILALPLLQAVADKKVAIFRGQGGRELLASTLRERGAQVDYVEVYRRMPAAHPANALPDHLSAGLDVIVITSGESLRQLTELAGDNTAALSLIPLLVPSARVADEARTAGFSTVLNAEGADQASMIAALQNFAAGADN